MQDSYNNGATRFTVDNRKVDSNLNQLGYGYDSVCKSNKGYDVKHTYSTLLIGIRCVRHKQMESCKGSIQVNENLNEAGLVVGRWVSAHYCIQHV